MTLGEIRGALIVGTIAFVVFPLIPPAGIGPWTRLDLRAAEAAVLAASALVFAGYVLFRRRPIPPAG